MGYERYPRNDRDWNDRDYGQDSGSARDHTYSSARDYQAAGELGGRGNQDRGSYGYGRDEDRGSYGRGSYGQSGYGQGGYGQGGYGQQRGGREDAGRSGYGGQYGGDRGQARYARGDEFHGSYASDGRRFTEYGDDGNDWRDQGRDRQGYGAAGYGAAYGGGRDGGYRGDRQRQGQGQGRGQYGRAPQGYDYEDRGFFSRAGDEVRSWFGDEDAERRREADARYDERYYNDRDADYGNWRRGQIAALDRDYDEYRRENRSKFENEFSTWRTKRQTQRQSLDQVSEHMEVVGSDGSHVGTVDKVRGDRILLTKNDADADGRHHSIPSNWIDTVDTKVTLSKSADEAKRQWRDEERSQALFGDQPEDGGRDAQGRILNRSFSGTY